MKRTHSNFWRTIRLNSKPKPTYATRLRLSTYPAVVSTDCCSGCNRRKSGLCAPHHPSQSHSHSHPPSCTNRHQHCTTAQPRHSPRIQHHPLQVQVGTSHLNALRAVCCARHVWESRSITSSPAPCIARAASASAPTCSSVHDAKLYHCQQSAEACRFDPVESSNPGTSAAAILLLQRVWIRRSLWRGP